MSRSPKDPVRMALVELSHRCTPFLDSLIADDQHHDPASLSLRVESYLRDDDVLHTYANGLAANQIVSEFIKRTSDRRIDRHQQDLFNSAEEVRDFMRHSTFEVGDGTIVRLTAVSYLDLERRHERMEKNRKAVSERCDDDAQMLALLRPHMIDKGLSHEEAQVAVWYDLHGGNDVCT
ncbi:hypothetical protein HDG34_002509 [Paraburkholderia sp. HC6.4b]|uniref:hypothetical protein n=1 Tax=unclassified Paraburkholderia TaxID=2615204 RepID=UPI00160CF840|nr:MULTISPECIES: hypothetical protein [unclassified Paraburkholderia]MBB5408572.1 hypothetical protein [Paraburkholderia sp. HC6.4b]MBB5450404.1 hypothetical protein [Paraburkholderia sp. Kb1A]